MAQHVKVLEKVLTKFEFCNVADAADLVGATDRYVDKITMKVYW